MYLRVYTALGALKTTLIQRDTLTTTLARSVTWVAGQGLFILLPDHSLYTQHQITVSATAAIDGVFDIRIIPDTTNPVQADSVNTKRKLELVSAKSAINMISHVLAGIHLEESTNFTNGDVLTIVISSTGGN